MTEDEYPVFLSAVRWRGRLYTAPLGQPLDVAAVGWVPEPVTKVTYPAPPPRPKVYTGDPTIVMPAGEKIIAGQRLRLSSDWKAVFLADAVAPLFGIAVTDAERGFPVVVREVTNESDGEVPRTPKGPETDPPSCRPPLTTEQTARMLFAVAWRGPWEIIEGWFCGVRPDGSLRFEIPVNPSGWRRVMGGLADLANRADIRWRHRHVRRGTKPYRAWRRNGGLA